MKKTKKLTCMLLIVAGLFSFIVIPAVAMNNTIQGIIRPMITTAATTSDEIIFDRTDFNTRTQAVNYYNNLYNSLFISYAFTTPIEHEGLVYLYYIYYDGHFVAFSAEMNI